MAHRQRIVPTLAQLRGRRSPNIRRTAPVLGNAAPLESSMKRLRDERIMLLNDIWLVALQLDGNTTRLGE